MKPKTLVLAVGGIFAVAWIIELIFIVILVSRMKNTLRDVQNDYNSQDASLSTIEAAIKAKNAEVTENTDDYTLPVATPFPVTLDNGITLSIIAKNKPGNTSDILLFTVKRADGTGSPCYILAKLYDPDKDKNVPPLSVKDYWKMQVELYCDQVFR